jgi:hypothetical protein
MPLADSSLRNIPPILLLCRKCRKKTKIAKKFSGQQESVRKLRMLDLDMRFLVLIVRCRAWQNAHLFKVQTNAYSNKGFCKSKVELIIVRVFYDRLIVFDFSSLFSSMTMQKTAPNTHGWSTILLRPPKIGHNSRSLLL